MPDSTKTRKERLSMDAAPPDIAATRPKTVEPDGRDALIDRARALQEAGDHAGATRTYTQILERWPDCAVAHNNLGAILAAGGDHAGALAAYGRAIAADSAYGEPLYNMGVLFQGRGETDQAARSYRAALALRPDHVAAHHNLALVLDGADRRDEALFHAGEAVRLGPQIPETWFNFGNLLGAAGRSDDAIAAFTRAATLRPDFPEALNNLAGLLIRRGRHHEAAELCLRAVRLRPAYGEARSNLGLALLGLGRTGDAIAAFGAAIRLMPGLAQAHANLGNALREQGRMDEALEACRRALELAPELPEAVVGLVHLRQHMCDWSVWREDEAALVALVRRRTGQVPPLALLGLDTGPGDQLTCARDWSAQFVPAAPLPAAPRRETDGRLRLGYASADFHQHATAYLTAEVFERHDRERFELFAYSFGPDDDSAMRRRLEAGFDHFVDIRALSPSEAARRIQDDGIDILIDLKGHTQNARTAIFAHRPAPVQLAFLGYPGTMGAAFIDGVLADPIVLPHDRQPFYSERIIHLPHCYQPNDSRRPLPAGAVERGRYGLPADGFVFCCFNNAFKIRPAIFDIWMRLLGRIPGAVLWLLDANPAVSVNLRRETARRGIDPARLIFAPRLALADHLARYAAADLFLDTLPYNAHTTASDALWVGLPVLTRQGDGFAGRVAASLLRAAGLPELITRTEAEYEDLALRLAGDPARLRAIRDRLENGRKTAPLFDCAGFTRDLEAVYRDLWHTHRQREDRETG